MLAKYTKHAKHSASVHQNATCGRKQGVFFFAPTLCEKWMPLNIMKKNTHYRTPTSCEKRNLKTNNDLQFSINLHAKTEDNQTRIGDQEGLKCFL